MKDKHSPPKQSSLLAAAVQQAQQHPTDTSIEVAFKLLCSNQRRRPDVKAWLADREERRWGAAVGRLPTAAEDAAWTPHDVDEQACLPRDHNAERYIIGVGARYPERFNEVLATGLTPRHFVDELHQRIFAVMVDQHARGGIEPALVGKQTDPGYLLICMDDVTTSAHVPTEAAKIIECKRKIDAHDHHFTLAKFALNGWSSDRLDRENESWLYERKRECEATEPQDTFSYAELRSKYPTLREPLIDGLMRVGETANIIANPKVGKSWFTYYLAMCLITGRSVFGKFPTTHRDALIVDNELHRETAGYRLPAVARAMGIDDDEINHRLKMKFLRGRLRSFDDVAAELRDQYEPGQFGLIVFDAKYRFAKPGESENDNSPEFYNSADCFATDMQSGLAFVHHSSKGSQSEKRLSDVGAGGGVQSRAVDCHAAFREHEDEDTHVFGALVRSFPPVAPIPVRWQWPLFVPDYDINPTLLKGKQTASEERQDERDKQGIDKIIDALRHGETATARQLRGKTGLSRERQQRLLDKLAADGDIASTEIVIKGNQTSEYSLPESDK